MSSIVDLPGDVSIDILSNWVNLLTVNNLDTALCNQMQRPLYLELRLSLPSYNRNAQLFPYYSKSSLYSMINWVLLRKIKLTNITLTKMAFKEEKFSEDFAALDKSHITEILFSITSLDDEPDVNPKKLTDQKFIDIINSCPKIVKLVLYLAPDSPFTDQVLDNINPQIMKHLKIFVCSRGTGMTGKAIQIFGTKCTNLRHFNTEVNLSDCQPEYYVDLIRNNLDLSNVTFARNVPSSSILEALAQYSRKLRFISCNTVDLDMPALIKIIENNPFLMNFQIDSIDFLGNDYDHFSYGTMRREDGKQRKCVKWRDSKHWSTDNEQNTIDALQFFTHVKGFHEIILSANNSISGAVLRAVANNNSELTKFYWFVNIDLPPVPVADVLYLLSKCTKLTQFYLVHAQYYSNDDLINIFTHLPKTVTQIEISKHNTITTDTVTAIIQQNEQLIGFDVAYCTYVHDGKVFQWLEDNERNVDYQPRRNTGHHFVENDENNDAAIEGDDGEEGNQLVVENEEELIDWEDNQEGDFAENNGDL